MENKARANQKHKLITCFAWRLVGRPIPPLLVLFPPPDVVVVLRLLATSGCMKWKESTLYQRNDTLPQLKSARETWAEPRHVSPPAPPCCWGWGGGDGSIAQTFTCNRNKVFSVKIVVTNFHNLQIASCLFLSINDAFKINAPNK